MEAIIGTAGWSIPAAHAEHFGEAGSALERYATRFRGVEINSSFHRPHRPSTWQRWAESVPASFRFSVKMPKTITHQKKLVDCRELLEAFLDEVAPLGDKLAVLLLQLPPKFAFDPVVVEAFLEQLLPRTAAKLACEPRHPSWFEPAPEALLAGLGVARVAADPVIVPAAAAPGGCPRLRYWRLHGSPVMYRSSYGHARLQAYGEAIEAELRQGREAWCMFDNTASSAATGDALALMQRLPESSTGPRGGLYF